MPECLLLPCLIYTNHVEKWWHRDFGKKTMESELLHVQRNTMEWPSSNVSRRASFHPGKSVCPGWCWYHPRFGTSQFLFGGIHKPNGFNPFFSNETIDIRPWTVLGAQRPCGGIHMRLQFQFPSFPTTWSYGTVIGYMYWLPSGFFYLAQQNLPWYPCRVGLHWITPLAAAGQNQGYIIKNCPCLAHGKWKISTWTPIYNEKIINNII